MTLDPMNVLLSALFAAGVFAAVAGLAGRRRASLREMEQLVGRGAPDLSPVEQLQRELDAARMGVTAGEFLRVSVVLALLGGLGTYLLSGAALAGLIGTALGGIAYWLYLANRAGKSLEAYEEELPQVLARLVSGARRGGSLEMAAEHVAQFGPELCRDDWRYIADQLRQGAKLSQVLEVVANRRGSILLNMVFEMLIVQRDRGTPLSEMLPGIQESLTERVTLLRRARTQLGGPIKELYLVASVPFVAVVLLRLLAPGYAEAYKTLPGQVVLLVGWGVTLAGFLVAYRAFVTALRDETSFGAPLKSQPRSPLPRPTESAAPASPMTPPGMAPAALRGVTDRSAPGGVR